MNNLDRLRELNKLRTKGEWKFEEFCDEPYGPDYVVDLGDYSFDNQAYYPSAPDKKDAEFSAISANMMDDLLELVESATGIAESLELMLNHKCPEFSESVATYLGGDGEKLNRLLAKLRGSNNHD